MHGEPAATELERWYAARGWTVAADGPPGCGVDGYGAHHGARGGFPGIPGGLGTGASRIAAGAVTAGGLAAGGAEAEARCEAESESRLWLLTGERFDVIEVPEQAGRDAAHRLLDYGQAALRPGPVGLTGPGRCGFLVAPGGAEDLPELLEWLDWGGIELGLTAHGEGGRVPAPGPRDWLHDPYAPAPEVVALLATIAQACWLERLGRSVPPVVPSNRPAPPAQRRGSGRDGGDDRDVSDAAAGRMRSVAGRAQSSAESRPDDQAGTAAGPEEPVTSEEPEPTDPEPTVLVGSPGGQTPPGRINRQAQWSRGR